MLQIRNISSKIIEKYIISFVIKILILKFFILKIIKIYF